MHAGTNMTRVAEARTLASDRPDWNQSGRESAGQRYADGVSVHPASPGP
jgi:hypothetical protein